MLKGKSAVVTGSTSGIGLAIARALAKEGANVMINGFGEKAAIEAERAGIEKELAVKAIYSPADMSKPAEIADMIKTAEKTLGSVDVLVNNAGIQFVAPIEEFPIDKWDMIIAINLTAAFHTIRTAVPGMKARKWGRIINTASAHSMVASPFKSAYVTAKHGLAGLTKTVALEVATFGITVNCISPGYVWTPLVAKQIPDQMKTRHMTEEQVKNDVLLAAQPTKQFVTVEQVARTVGGRPLLADGQSAVFSPFSLVSYVLPFWKSLAVVAMLKLFLGAFGAYVAATRASCELLVNRARPLIFSTGLPPALPHAALTALGILSGAEGDALRARLRRNVERFAAGLRSLGLPAEAVTPIFPVVLGAPEAALSAAGQLRKRGLLVKAIRPPTVPAGSSRLRIAVTAAHTDAHLDLLLSALREAA